MNSVTIILFGLFAETVETSELRIEPQQLTTVSGKTVEFQCGPSASGPITWSFSSKIYSGADEDVNHCDVSDAGWDDITISGVVGPALNETYNIYNNGNAFYSLVLKSVSVSSGGTYRCCVPYGPPVFAFLTVVDSSPNWEFRNFSKAETSKLKYLQLRFLYSGPVPNITWRLPGREEVSCDQTVNGVDCTLASYSEDDVRILQQTLSTESSGVIEFTRDMTELINTDQLCNWTKVNLSVVTPGDTYTFYASDVIIGSLTCLRCCGDTESDTETSTDFLAHKNDTNDVLSSGNYTDLVFVFVAILSAATLGLSLYVVHLRRINTNFHRTSRVMTIKVVATPAGIVQRNGYGEGDINGAETATTSEEDVREDAGDYMRLGSATALESSSVYDLLKGSRQSMQSERGEIDTPQYAEEEEVKTKEEDKEKDKKNKEGKKDKEEEGKEKDKEEDKEEDKEDKEGVVMKKRVERVLPPYENVILLVPQTP